MQSNFFTQKNLIGFGIGIGLLIFGFYALSRPPVNSVWSLNVAPIVLCIAYCIIFPVAIMLNGTKKSDENKKGA